MKKIKDFESKLIESWYNRTLPWIDLDHPTANGFANEYCMTREEWMKSIKKDLKKYYKFMKLNNLHREKVDKR